jgi:hypothetical protein
VSSTSPKLSNTAVWIVTAGREMVGDGRFRGDIAVTQAHSKAFGFDSGSVEKQGLPGTQEITGMPEAVGPVRSSTLPDPYQ